MSRPGTGNTGRSPWVLVLFAGLTVLLCGAGYYLASSYPDGLEAIARSLGFAGKARPLAGRSLAERELPFLRSPAGRNIMAAFLGAAICFLAAFGIGRYSSRREKPVAPGPARPLE